MMRYHTNEYDCKCGVPIGDNCKFFGCISFGSEPIGNNVQFSDNVTLITHYNCFIGHSARILPGVEVGPNSIVGVGSIVTKSVPTNSVYAGNPARFICTIDEYKEKVLRQTPEYDLEEYKANKKEAVLKMLGDRLSFND